MMDKHRDKDSQFTKDEYGLYLVNSKALNSVLFIRKLASNDQVMKIYGRSVEVFKRDADRFKLCYVKVSDIDAYLKQKGVFQTHFDEEN